jgi:hypothetical protein
MGGARMLAVEEENGTRGRCKPKKEAYSAEGAMGVRADWVG